MRITNNSSTSMEYLLLEIGLVGALLELVEPVGEVIIPISVRILCMPYKQAVHASIRN